MSQYNALHSKLKNIYLGESENLSLIQKNEYCQFEKIEFTESMLDLLPQGSITVRDTSDIMTYISENRIESIVLEYENLPKQICFITNYTFINNAGSSTEENFVTIHFSNYLFKLAQNLSVSEVFTTPYPQVHKINDFYEKEIIPKINNYIDSPYEKITFDNQSVATKNYMVYRPINPLEDKIDIASENVLQYMYYISSMACDSNDNLPRFLFWTGLNNEVYLKYFPEIITDDPGYDSGNDERNYAVYESDVPSINKNDGKKYKKIYQLKTNPASQYYNRKYYYNRLTPRLLNKDTTQTNQEIILFNHQYEDEGIRTDRELITAEGIVSILPSSTGISSFEYNKPYGYYTKNDIDNNFRNSTLMSMEYGVKNAYSSKAFMSSVAPYPMVDTPEMWKNCFDLTPLHPNLGSSESDMPGKDTNLQKVYEIRNASKGSELKRAQMQAIEKQNFILYVLCCIGGPDQDEQEESFFACITGWAQDSTNQKNGYNSEPLIYRYTWNRIEVNLTTPNATNFTDFSNPEYQRWQYSSEKSSPNDVTTWAINLNERTNIMESQESSGYYGPGWYGKNLTETLFNDVTYRPIGNRTGNLQTSSSSESCKFIVKMTKVPYIKIIKNALNYSAVVTTNSVLEELIAASKGKYVYYFEMANITDGPCNIQQQGGQ